jgi:DNA primase
MFERTAAGLDLTTARDKSNAVDRLLPVIAAINNPVRQAHYLQKLAGLIKVDMNTIKASLSRLTVAPARRLTRKEGPKPATSAKSERMLGHSPREEYLLALLVQNPGLTECLEELSPEYFTCTENREIFNLWRENGDMVILKERVDPAIREHLDGIIGRKMPETRNNIENRVADCVSELKKTYLKNLAARLAETGEIRAEIPIQLRELDARKSRKRSSTYTGKVRR